MNLWRIAWHYLWNRKLTTSVTVLSVALGVALISSVLTLRDETRRQFEEEGQAFDIVVGGKGSPLQLVLSTVYLIDAPNQNVPYEEYRRLQSHEDVSAAFPIGLGDSYRGFRIVGTHRDLFDHSYVVDTYKGTERHPFELHEGEYFTEPFQAVVGAAVAEEAGLALGDQFEGHHGLVEGFQAGGVHPEDLSPYTVVGILERSYTPYDRALFCDLASVWMSHEHPEDADHDSETDPIAEEEQHALPHEVSAILVQLNTPGQRWRFIEDINDNTGAMAASPVEQIQRLYYQLLAPIQAMLKGLGFLVVVVSALSILTGLYLSILQRRRDLAIMRALGASATDVFGLVILEGFWVTILGIAAGWMLGNVVSFLLGIYLQSKYGIHISAFGMPGAETINAFALVALIGLMAGILPARQAYRTDVVRDLAES